MPPPDGNAPAEGSQQQAPGPQTPPQQSPSESYMRDTTVPIPEERPLLREKLSAPAGSPQPVAPRSPLSQSQVAESPVSVVLVQPLHPAAPLGEPLHPHEDLIVSADEKDLAHGSCSYTGGVGKPASEERPLLPDGQNAPARFPALDVPSLAHKRLQLLDASPSELSQPVRVVLCEEPDPTAPPEEPPHPLKDLAVNYNEKGLSEQQKLIITVISVVAVLVANVSFLGYVTPPGGPHPYWETCNNSVYVAFLVLNGLAFLFSLGATGVVVVLPWLYPEKDAGIHKVSINWWISWGLSLLFSSILFFTIAFAAAGLVTGGFKAPELQCGVLPCDYGGMPCVPSTQADTDVFKTLLALNNMSGDCFAVWGVARGSDIPDGLVGGSTKFSRSPLQYTNHGSMNFSSNFSADFNRDACYLMIRDIDNTNPDQHLSHTKNILCTAGLVPSGYDSWGLLVQGVDAQAAGRVDYRDALVNMTTAGNFWWSGRTAPQDGSLNTWYYMIPDTSAPGSRCSASASPGCACSHSMINHWNEGNLMFVTHAPHGRSKGVYAASLANKSHHVENTQRANGRFYKLHNAQVPSQDWQATELYAPALFRRENVAVYDESHIRCFQSAKAPQLPPTLCMFRREARDDYPKWYSPVNGSSSVFQRQCGLRNSTEKCAGLAVDTQGALIMTAKLGDFGYEVVYDVHYIENLGQQTGIFAFVILAIALSLYACVFVAVWCCRRLCKRCA